MPSQAQQGANRVAEWTVLCRGPSLVRVLPRDILDASRVIAINGAVKHHATPCSHWLGIDRPGRFIDTSDPRPWGPGPAPTVVTRADRVPEWKASWPELDFVAYCDHKPSVRSSLPWRSSVDWLHYSVLLALHYAAIHGAARRIRILGADMEGIDYAYSDAKIELRKKGMTPEQSRWDGERRWLARASEELYKHAGVVVERVKIP